MLAPLALDYIRYFLWILTAPTWWCLLLLIYTWYFPMLLYDICPATWWYLWALSDFQVCGMPPPIRVPSVEACGTAVWSNFGFWFEPRSEPATFKIRPTHTIVPSVILLNVQCSILFNQCTMFNVQYSLFNVQCSMFCVQCSTLNVQFWRSDQHTQSIHHSHCTIPYNCNCFSTNKFSRKVCDHTIPPSLTDQNPFFPLSSTLTNSINTNGAY